MIVKPFNFSHHIFSLTPSSLSFQETLPKYFNHSKFSSFVRQLNFYGFQKLNLDTDLTSSVPHTPSNAARFSHDFFRRGMPELLPKIQRSTAKAKSPASVESDDHDQLQKQVEDLKNQLNHMQQQMDMKLEKTVQALQSDYIAQVARLELNYKSCIQGLSVLLQEKLSPSVSSVLHNLQRLQASGCLNT